MSGPQVIVRPLRCDGGGHSAQGAAWFREPVALVEGDAELLAAAKRVLPDGLATDEAILVTLRRRGTAARLGEPVVVSRETYLDHMLEWGRASVRLVRVSRDLLTEVRLGTWADANGAARLRRTLAVALPRGFVSRLGPYEDAGEAAFWRGARSEATTTEWRRLTAAYSVLVYHRLAGERRPGQERIDMPAEVFHRHLRTLRWGRRAAVEAGRLVAFHRSGESLSERRVTVLTVDDVTDDVLVPLASTARFHPQLFAVTSAVGDAAGWLGGVPLASWDDLRRLAGNGVEIGAHSRTHPRDLRLLTDSALRAEIEGSRRDLANGVGRLPVLFAYPNGCHDARVRQVVADAGFALAYSTDPGLNGAGTHPFALRRVSAKAWDTRLSILWKAYTGRPVPGPWERWLLLRHAAVRRAAAAAMRR